jgi:hypothetical protein
MPALSSLNLVRAPPASCRDRPALGRGRHRERCNRGQKGSGFPFLLHLGPSCSMCATIASQRAAAPCRPPALAGRGGTLLSQTWPVPDCWAGLALTCGKGGCAGGGEVAHRLCADGGVGGDLVGKQRGGCSRAEAEAGAVGARGTRVKRSVMFIRPLLRPHTGKGSHKNNPVHPCFHLKTRPVLPLFPPSPIAGPHPLTHRSACHCTSGQPGSRGQCSPRPHSTEARVGGGQGQAGSGSVTRPAGSQPGQLPSCCPLLASRHSAAPLLSAAAAAAPPLRFAADTAAAAAALPPADQLLACWQPPCLPAWHAHPAHLGDC